MPAARWRGSSRGYYGATVAPSHRIVDARDPLVEAMRYSRDRPARACRRAPRGGGAGARRPAPAHLWATVNVCDTRARPDTIGIRGSMPGLRRPATLLHALPGAVPRPRGALADPARRPGRLRLGARRTNGRRRARRRLELSHRAARARWRPPAARAGGLTAGTAAGGPSAGARRSPRAGTAARAAPTRPGTARPSAHEPRLNSRGSLVITPVTPMRGERADAPRVVDRPDVELAARAAHDVARGRA